MSNTPYSSQEAPPPAETAKQLRGFSAGIIDPLRPHLARFNSFEPWLTYCLDTWIVHNFPISNPIIENFCWLQQIDDQAQLDRWLTANSHHQRSIGWQISVASATHQAAQTWFGPGIEGTYLEQSHHHHKAFCDAIDCGQSQGLALELYATLQADQQSFDDAGQQALILHEQQVLLSDLTSGVAQLLASIKPGELLPPFFNGESWLILRLGRRELPTIESLTPLLLRNAIQAWRQQVINAMEVLLLDELNPAQPTG